MSHFNLPGWGSQWIISHVFRFSVLQQESTLIRSGLAKQGINILAKPVGIALEIIIAGSHEQFIFMIRSRLKSFSCLVFEIAETAFDPATDIWISLLPTAIAGKRTDTLQVITICKLLQNKIRTRRRRFSDGKARMSAVIEQCYGAPRTTKNLCQQRARKTRP